MRNLNTTRAARQIRTGRTLQRRRGCDIADTSYDYSAEAFAVQEATEQLSMVSPSSFCRTCLITVWMEESRLLGEPLMTYPEPPAANAAAITSGSPWEL